MWLLALLSCVGLMICGTPVQGDPPNRDELQLTTQPVVTAAAAPLFSGAGTETNPYKISSGEDMIALSTTTDYSTYWGISSGAVYYKLTNDITVIADTWTPIGNGTNKFYGVFDGCGKTITIQAQSSSDITINTVDTGNIQYVGVFGCAADNSLIANLVVKHSNSLVCLLGAELTGAVYVGGVGGYLPAVYNVTSICHELVFYNEDDELVNCHVYIGGIAGYGGGWEERDNVLCNLYSSVDNLTGFNAALMKFGGVVGKAKLTTSDSLTIQNCAFALGNVDYDISDMIAGGIVGCVDGQTKITVSNCYAMGLNFSGNSLCAGGIIGDCNLKSGSSFSHCYVEGLMTINQYAGSYTGKMGTIAAASNLTSSGFATSGIEINDCQFNLTCSPDVTTHPSLLLQIGDSNSSVAKYGAWVGTNFTSANGWSADIWVIEEDQWGTKHIPSLNVAGIYRAEHPVVGTAFTVIFNNDTPKGGLFLYVLCIDSTGASKYSEIRQYYFEGINETETIYYKLTEGANYKVLISKPYVWEFTIEGTTDLSGTAANGQFTFTAPAPDVGGTVTITASGGTPPNNFAVV